MIEYRAHPAYQAMRAGRSDLAIGILQRELNTRPRDAICWKLLGFALHEEQLEPEAVEALQNARTLALDDVQVAMALAQSCFNAGYPAIRAFVDVMRVDPHNLDALRGYALAISAGGDSEEGIKALSTALKDHPSWIAGHKLLASLRYTAGDSSHFADSYATACGVRRDDLQLRMAWFQSLAQVRDWDGALGVLDDAEQIFNDNSALKLARLFVAEEKGDDQIAEELFDQTQALDDILRDMSLVRFSLRRGDLKTAESVCNRRVERSNPQVFWPYLSLVWRLNGDERYQWLESSGEFVRTIDLDIPRGELDSLERRLQLLHSKVQPFAEQSVRGGTQTDQNLFLRHEPEIRALRNRIVEAVKTYVASLPSIDVAHPFLSVDRNDVLQNRVHFSGSWSVRLQSQGYNVAHTHPMGWLSSAFYVSLPSVEQMGAEPSGWIQFGSAPPELGLKLEPTMRKQPKIGRLVLFPSTTWHSTVPFIDGERLVVAFDVRIPRVYFEDSTTEAA